MLDIYAIGDTSLDVFLKISEVTELCQIKTEECLACLTYADKIPAESLNFSVGGNAPNLCVGAARLGLKTAVCSVIGDDDIGKRIIKTFKAEKIDHRCLRVDKKAGSNYSTILNYDGERTILVYHYPRHYPVPNLPKAKWVFLSSIGPDFVRHHRSLLKEVARIGAKFAFNPGTHQLKLGLGGLQPLLAVTDALFVNVEEAMRILGITNHPDIKELMISLSKLGPKTVYVTDGPAGAYAWDGNKSYFMKVFPAPRIEATGAGDAFASGVLSGLVKVGDFKEALRWGPIQSAGVIQKIGPQAGYYRWPELAKILKDNPNFQPQPI